jgi:sarcosine/dimethylglycine N-methyltransferase
MTEHQNQAVCTARDYYNSSDADQFYFQIWGGEDIHIGLYKAPGETIAAASRRTVEHMAGMFGPVNPGLKVLDLGSGFGGSARFLAKTLDCHVTALNLSECQNVRNRELSAAQGLSSQIEVVDGSFEEVPFPDANFDVVWSQDAILHSGKREVVVAEAARVLKPGGMFLFTDPMQADDCPAGVLDPILARIHLETLGSPGFYRQATAAHGLKEKAFEDLTPHMATHYQRVLDELSARQAELSAHVSQEYIEKMKTGLGHWVDGAKAGHLCWGVFCFTKPA